MQENLLYIDYSYYLTLLNSCDCKITIGCNLTFWVHQGGPKLVKSNTSNDHISMPYEIIHPYIVYEGTIHL